MVMDLRLPIAAVGACISLLSVQALFATSEYRRIGGDILISLTLIVGVLTSFTAPVLSGLVRYTTAGIFQYTWWG
jgi:hypothetical protein